MKISTPMALAALVISLTSCATPRPPQAFHNTDNTAVVTESLDDKTSQMLEPAVSGREKTDAVLAKAVGQNQRQTVEVILENSSEPQIGLQYRIRGTPWFVGLLGLGCSYVLRHDHRYHRCIDAE